MKSHFTPPLETDSFHAQLRFIPVVYLYPDCAPPDRAVLHFMDVKQFTYLFPAGEKAGGCQFLMTADKTPLRTCIPLCMNTGSQFT